MMNPSAELFDSIGEKFGWWYPNSFDKCKEHFFYKIEKQNIEENVWCSNGAESTTNTELN